MRSGETCEQNRGDVGTRSSRRDAWRPSCKAESPSSAPGRLRFHTSALVSASHAALFPEPLISHTDTAQRAACVCVDPNKTLLFNQILRSTTSETRHSVQAPDALSPHASTLAPKSLCTSLVRRTLHAESQQRGPLTWSSAVAVKLEEVRLGPDVARAPRDSDRDVALDCDSVHLPRCACQDAVMCCTSQDADG